jgi:hypothetical protein
VSSAVGGRGQVKQNFVRQLRTSLRRTNPRVIFQTNTPGGEQLRLVYALWGLILIASLIVLPTDATSGVAGSQMYCNHPTHGKGGFYGPCHPGTNSPVTGKDLNDHVKANPSHSGYVIAQPCTS